MTEEFLDRDYFAPAYEKADSAKPKREKLAKAAVDSLEPLRVTAEFVRIADEADLGSLPAATVVAVVNPDVEIPPSSLVAEPYDSDEL